MKFSILVDTCLKIYHVYNVLGSYIFCHCTVFNFSFELFFMLRRFETFMKREREREREEEEEEEEEEEVM